MFVFVRYALSISVVMALVACSPFGGDSAEVSPGLREYASDIYRLSYPSGWGVREKPGMRRPTVELNGPPRDDGTRAGEVRVVNWGKWNTALRDKAVQYRQAAPREGRTIEKDYPVMVNGAEEAHRFEVAYEVKTATGAKVRMRMFETFVLTRKRLLLDFIVQFPKDAEGQGQVKAILNSFDAREKDGWFGNR